MPAPILQIPIDDKDFRAFVETFKKYQEELKNQPAAWDSVSSSIRDSVSVADEFAKALQSQLDGIESISRAEESRDRKREDSARRRKKERDDEDRDEEKRNNRRRQLLDQVREYSRNIGDVARKGGGAAVNAIEGSIGAIGGGAAGLFGAAGGMLKSIPYVGGALGGAVLAGYEVMSMMNRTRQSAHGLGIDVQTLQGWQDAMGPYLPAGSAEHLLQTVSEAQANPGQWGVFSRFGIKNIKGRDVSSLSAEMLQNAQRTLQTGDKTDAMTRAQALYGGVLDTGTLRTLQGMSPKELKEHLDTMKKFAKEHGDAEATAKKLTDSLSSAELTATGIVNNFGSALAGATDQVTDALHKLFDVIQPFLTAKQMWHDVTTPGGLFKLKGDYARPGDDRYHPGTNLLGGGHENSGYGAVVGGVMKFAKGIYNYTLGELKQFDPSIRAAARSAGLGNSSALGQYQIVGRTRERVGRALWGKDWEKQMYDPAHQEQMARYIWEHEARYGNAHAVFASLPDSRRGAYSAYSFDQIRGRLARGEGGLPHNDTGHVAKAVAEGVKKGTVKAHQHMQHRGAHVKVKVQQKPGSDVTVSSRQLAGR